MEQIKEGGTQARATEVTKGEQARLTEVTTGEQQRLTVQEQGLQARKSQLQQQMQDNYVAARNRDWSQQAYRVAGQALGGGNSPQPPGMVQ